MAQGGWLLAAVRRLQAVVDALRLAIVVGEAHADLRARRNSTGSQYGRRDGKPDLHRARLTVVPGIIRNRLHCDAAGGSCRLIEVAAPLLFGCGPGLAGNGDHAAEQPRLTCDLELGFARQPERRERLG